MNEYIKLIDTIIKQMGWVCRVLGSDCQTVTLIFVGKTASSLVTTAFFIDDVAVMAR